MPNLVGQKLDMAISILKTYGFAEPEYEDVYSNKDVGIVVSQSVEKDTKVPLTTVIMLQVSKGPEPTEPETTEASTQENTAPQEVTKDVILDLIGLITEDNTLVEIKRSGEVVYSGYHSPENTTVTIYNQTGSGVVSYEVYIGGSEEPTRVEKEIFTTNG